MMLRAALADFCALNDVAIVTTRDARLPSLDHAAEIITVQGEPWEVWRRCIATTDAALIVAPETGGVLERLNRMVEDAGKLLLGCSSPAVALTASKITTLNTFAQHGVRVPETVYWGTRPPKGDDGYVVKPDDGAGSEDTFFFATAAEFSGWSPPDIRRTWIAQSYVPGRAMSLSLLCGPGRAAVLTVNEQLRDREGEVLRQTGTLVNPSPQPRSAMQGLADQLVGLLPGLRGFVGVDYIETGAGPVVLEINPRLTTSYVAASRSLGVNAAQLIVEACLGRGEAMTRTPASCLWRVEVPHLA